MSSIVNVKKKPHVPKSNIQQTFNKLRKKLTTLQQDHETQLRDFDDCLSFHFTEIQPKERQFNKTLKQFLIVLYGHYQQKILPKKDQSYFKRFLKEMVTDVVQSHPIQEIEDEIKVIFKELHGIDVESFFRDDFEEFKEELEEMLEEGGIDVDLSDLGMDGNPEEMFDKIFGSMDDSFFEEESQDDEKERSEKKMEDIQKNGIKTIYKQLAKNLHPDLEQNPEQKIQKEALMKQLTCAYEQKDLFAMLSMEAELSVESKSTRSDEELKIYNEILKDQVNDLKEKIDLSLSDPKYLPLHPYFNIPFFSGLPTLESIRKDVEIETRNLEKTIQSLKGENSLKALQKILFG